MKMDDDNISYRTANQSDAETIKSILINTFEEYAIDLPDNYSFSDIDDIGNCYIGQDGEFVVLSREGRVIGFVGLLPIDSTRIELKRLYLVRDERGKGLGRYLLSMALNFSKEKGYRTIQLETSSKFKEAVALYEKNGFVDNVKADKTDVHDVALSKPL